MDSGKIQSLDDSAKFETGMGPMTDSILNLILEKISTTNFREKLTDNIMCPISQMVNQRIRPYVYISVVLYCIIIILLLAIIYLLLKKNKQ